MRRFAIALVVGLLASCVGGDPAPIRGAGSDIDAGPARTVFVTSRTYGADLGGYDGADAKCNELARAAMLSGFYRAWLSIGTTGAASRLPFAGGYARTDGRLVAKSRQDLLGGTLLVQIDLDENVTRVSGNLKVWTNTKETGEAAREGYDCAGFTSTLPSPPRSTASPGGTATALDARWTVGSDAHACSEQARLYCFAGE
jgi:hypothetical protein